MANIGYGQDYTGVQSPFTVQVDKSLTKTGWAYMCAGMLRADINNAMWKHSLK